MNETQLANEPQPVVAVSSHDESVIGTLLDLVEAQVRRFPHRRLYTFCRDDGSTRSLTFGSLDQRARAIAAVLERELVPGQRALLVYPAGLDFITAFFGCLYARVLAVPATYPKPRRPMPRLSAIAQDCGASVALTTSQTLASLELGKLGSELRQLGWLATDAIDDEAARQWRRPEVAAEDLAFLQYTSGSTSDPKGVMVTHGNLLHNLEMIRQGFGLTPHAGYSQSRTGVFWLPAYHDMGLIGAILEALYVGWHSVLMTPESFLQRPLRWLKAISDYRAVVSGAPNFAFELCATRTTPEQRAELDLSNWRVAFCGAEPVHPETLERFAEAFAPAGFRAEAFYPCYGLAEATLLAAGGTSPGKPVVKRLDRAALAEHRVVEVHDGESTTAQRLVGCGHALAGQEVAIVDPETHRRCAADRVGEIWIAGPSVAAGYWNRPEESEPTFRARLADGGLRKFLRSGDLGFVRDGQLFVTGRIKDVIIIRGRNHYPQDLEQTMSASHPALRLGAGAAFSVSEGDEEHLVVVHEVDRQHRDADLDRVIQRIRRTIAEAHELDVHAVVLIRQASLPRTTSGKAQRNLCRRHYLAGELKVLAQWTKPAARWGHTQTTASGAAACVNPRCTARAGAGEATGGGASGVAADRGTINGSAANGHQGEATAAEQISATAVRRTSSRARPSAKVPPLPTPATAEDIDRLAERIEAWLLDWLVKRAAIAAGDVARDKPFAEYGLDSLTAVEMSQELEDWLGIALTPTIAWNYPTPMALGRYLAREAAGLDSEAADDGLASEGGQDSAFERLLKEIETLSDREAEAALEAEPSDNGMHPRDQ